MRVLYVSKALASAVHRDKVNALSRHSEIVAVTPERWGRRAAEPGTATDAPLRWERPWLSGVNHFHVYPRAAAILDEVRPDLVHVDEEPYSAVTWQFAGLCRRRNTPFVFFAWQNIAKQLPLPFQAMRRQVFKRAAGAIAGTPDAARVLRRLGYGGPAAIIPQFGVDGDRFYPDALERRDVRRSWRIGEDRFLVGFVGRLVPEKGIDTLVEAVSRTPDADLIVIGDGPERHALASLAKRAGCGGRVRLVGAIPSRSVGRALRGFDVLVLPSRTSGRWAEQFGRAMVEAMATEVPVIATRTGSIPWVAGEAAVLVPPDDPDALRQAIGAFMADPGRRTELAKRGRTMVASRFTTQAIVGQTVEWYRLLMGDRVAEAAAVP